jgi:hypothetical protein
MRVATSLCKVVWRRSCFPRGNPLSRLYSDLHETTYIPDIGTESYIHELGISRTLLGTEYQLAFQLFPGLVNLGTSWRPSATKRASLATLSLEDIVRIENENEDSSSPQADSIDGSDHDQRPIESLVWALDYHKQSPLEKSDVVKSLERFRKEIGGLDNYQITNPGTVADRYRLLLRDCLAVEDCWGSAENELEQAGFVMKNHVDYVEVHDDLIEGMRGIPVVVVPSVFREAVVRLLDFELNDGDILEPEQQIIQDMLLLIMRVCVRAILSRKGDIHYVVVDYDYVSSESSVVQWMPPLSAVKAVLSMDFNVLQEEDTENGLRFFVSGGNKDLN